MGDGSKAHGGGAFEGVSGFSAEWLALRERADAAARSESLISFVGRGRGPERAAPQILDLGGGTGSNIRYLSSRLPSPQHWTLVDDDPALLAHVPPGVTARRADLNAAVQDADLFRGCSLVTASALLDLVSDAWLAQLIRQCRAAGAAVLFALTYDGRISCTPSDPEDAEVRRLVNEHQKTDKGFGPALGPDAAGRAVALLSAAGYEMKQEQSDWKLERGAVDLQRELIAGWAAAATEIAPDRQAVIAGWRARRLTHVDAGRSHLLVGHIDVAARIDIA
jgi:hypothetical protein